jgi:predicted alpha/beta-fold hydrolase
MEFFIAGLIFYPLLKGKSKQFQIVRRINERNLENYCEICCSEEIKTDIYRIVEKCAEENPHIPSLIELLDYHGVLQTAISASMKNFIKIAHPFYRNGVVYLSEQVKMSDGGTIGLEWGVQIEEYRKNPHMTINDLKKEKIVILLHGFLGDSHSEYIYYFIPQLIQAGYTPVVYVARGCSDLTLTSDSLPNGKVCSDMYEITRYIKKNYQSVRTNNNQYIVDEKKKVFAIGYSIGGASLLNYISRIKEYSYLSAAISICPPWDIIKNSFEASYLSYFFSFLISVPLKLFLLKHYFYLASSNNVNQDNTNEVEMSNMPSIWKILFQTRFLPDFDALLYPIYYKCSLPQNYQREKQLHQKYDQDDILNYYHPIHSTEKYSSLMEFYEDINATNYLHQISIPTLVLAAKDDPICMESFIPSSKEDCTSFGSNLIVVGIFRFFLLLSFFFLLI